MNTDRLAVSIKTAAYMTDLSEDTIRAAINKGHLPAKRIGTAIRVRVEDLNAWLDSLDQAVAS